MEIATMATSETPLRPIQTQMQPVPITPDDRSPSPLPLLSQQCELERLLDKERQLRKRADNKVKSILNCIRMVTLQMKEADLTLDLSSDTPSGVTALDKIGEDADDSTVQTSCDLTLASEDSHRCRTWSGLSICEDEHQLLSGMEGSTLMALENAVLMIQQHARLVAREAVLAVRDQDHLAHEKALNLEMDNQTLKDQNDLLSRQLEKVNAEKKVLVREVKHLRKELSSVKKDNAWNQLQQYVIGALTAHEQNLKSKPNMEQASAPTETTGVPESSHAAPSDKPESTSLPANSMTVGQVINKSIPDPSMSRRAFGTFGSSMGLMRTRPLNPKKVAPLQPNPEEKNLAIKSPVEAKLSDASYHPVTFPRETIISPIGRTTSGDSSEGQQRKTGFHQFLSGKCATFSSMLLLAPDVGEGSMRQRLDSTGRSVDSNKLPANVSYDEASRAPTVSPLPTPMDSPMTWGRPCLDVDQDDYVLDELAFPSNFR